MASLIGEITCEDLDLLGPIMARLFYEVEIMGGECSITDVSAVCMLDADPSSEQIEQSYLNLSFSQTPDEDLVIENSDGEKLEPCLWSFSFLVDKYSLYAFVDDLLLELYSMGAIVGFIIDKHLSDEVIAQN